MTTDFTQPSPQINPAEAVLPISLLEVKRWVLCYGAACQVLAPLELRREVMEEIHRLATTYATTSDTT